VVSIDTVQGWHYRPSICTKAFTPLQEMEKGTVAMARGIKYEVDYYNDGDIPHTPEELKAWIDKKVAEVPKRYRDSIECGLDTEDGELYIKYSRYENKEEYKNRLDEERAEEKSTKECEIRELNRLLKKYKGINNET